MGHLFERVRTKGLRGTSRAVADRLEEWILEPYYERRLGIVTCGTVSREALGYDDADCHAYGASTYGNIRRIVRTLNVQPGSRDVLLDFGSGKGRVLVLAAMHPFVRIVGVERSAELNDVARRNIERARRRLTCRNIDVVTIDAATYDLPDEVTIVYFASPFGGDVLHAVLDNIKASLIRAPRPLSVVSHGYDASNPFESRLRECAWLYVRSEIPLQRSNYAWIYGNSRWNARAAVCATQLNT